MAMVVKGRMEVWVSSEHKACACKVRAYELCIVDEKFEMDIWTLLSHRVRCSIKKSSTQAKSAADHRYARWISSYLIATHFGRWVAFWKALVKLYRFGVYSASLEPNLMIQSVKNGATLCIARPNLKSGFASRISSMSMESIMTN